MIQFAATGIRGRRALFRRRVRAGGTSTVLKTLGSLAAVSPEYRVAGDRSIPIHDLAYDSRAVAPGALFFCVRGGSTDGHDHAASAVAAGAAGLVVERELPLPVAQVRVPGVRAAMGPIAAEFFDHPAEAMTLVGVTGTNGKTTTTFLLESVFRALGTTAGVIGTVETHVGDEVLPVTRTTPEAIDVQRLLVRMRDARVGAVAMEVSSHGLEQGRAAGCRFGCAVFTNLTQDHLDYHGTMEEYFRAKARLFTPAMAERAVVNLDDPFGRRLAQDLPLPSTTFAIERDADVVAVEMSLERTGSVVVASVGGRRVEMRLRIPARYNVSNALGVLAAGHALGLPLEETARGIESLRGVPGRLEPVDAGQDFAVLVDYAHTPDSLEGVLRGARAIVPDGARLTVVFGCGGDRDRGKRPLMGRVAAALADRVIITSDNPRSEDPGAIIAAIEAGARDAGMPFESIPDRREAIAAALAGARTGDVVVIAGKGHETGQEIAGRTIPFDDRVVAREVLAGIER